ncbi:MAG TPA: hypothetical protein PLZ86_06725, partial [bacterium]|nr:hypothetical protein [bacterium]
MKRDLFVFTFMAFVAVSFFCATAVAQTFSPPIPVGAKYDGTLTTGGIKSEATHLRFFNHPTIPGTNFSSSSVEIDGKKYKVDALMATPGWISKQFSITENDSGTKMVLGLPGRVGKPQMAPLHGVCPGNTFVKDPVSPQVFADCRLWPINNVEAEQNYVDRRLEIARIRNTTSSDPMLALIGDPLLDGVVGDASEDQSPYSPMTYPALVDSETGRNDDPFKPWWMLKYPDAQGYKQTISYGLDEIRGIGGLHVTTVYDPFDLGITAQVATGMVLGNKIQNLKWVADIGMKEYWKILWPNRPAPDASEFGLPFYSPVGFFLSVPGQGVKFAGYTALHQAPKDGSGYTHRQNPDGSYVPLADEVTRRAARYSANFGPVAVVAMDYSSSEPHRKDGFAVVNQGTLMSLDDYVIALGIVLRDSNGNPLRWRDVIGIVNADGSFSGISPNQMPHSVVSYVPFWARSVDAFTGKPIVAASSGHLQDTGNPNFAFDPFRVGLVGPGMFYAAKMTDKAGGAKRHTLVVPSGEAADDGNFYVYKLDPIGGPQLRMKLNPQATPPPMGGIAPPVKLPLVLPEAYRVDVPDGFAPYQVAVADVWKDNDGCDDIILSFRGRITEHPFGNDAFRNEPGQTVLFRTSDAADPDNALAMFASEVRAYKGIPAKVGCAISSEQQDIRIFNVPRKFAQLAAIAVDDFDGDRIDDLLVGDLTPRQIGSEGGTGKKADEYTGYAWLFPGILSGAVNSQAIRTGFFSKKIDEPTGDWLRIAVDSGEIEALP